MDDARRADLPAELEAFAEQVRHALGAPVPRAPGARALFVEGASARTGFSPARLLAPLAATAALLAGVLWVGSQARPGDTFYPVKQMLRSVGLAEPALDEVDDLVAAARTLVERAESGGSGARAAAVNALELLEEARHLLAAVEEPDEAIRYARIEGLERRAAAALAAETELREESSDHREGRDDREDNSGPGTGEDDADGDDDRDDDEPGDDDNSGSGSGDDDGDDDRDDDEPGDDDSDRDDRDDRDNSGSGGGGDEPDDDSDRDDGDNSGSGSDDEPDEPDEPDDEVDNSGSGSGDEPDELELPDPGEDNSGSGSGD